MQRLSPAASLISFSLFLFFSPCFSSPLCILEAAAAKSYGQACAEPGNNGIRFLTFPRIKVSHKGKKPPRLNRREILKTPDKWTSPNECIMYGSSVCYSLWSLTVAVYDVRTDLPTRAANDIGKQAWVLARRHAGSTWKLRVSQRTSAVR